MQAGYVVFLADRVQPALSAAVKPGTHILVQRSKPVSIIVDGRRLKTRTHRDAVGDVLADMNIVLYGDDYTTPPLSQPVAPNMEIRVSRRSNSLVIDQEPIPFDTRWAADPELELDSQALGQEGWPGVRERRTYVTYEDGSEINREVIADFVAREPEPRIYRYGTKVIVRTLDTPEGPVQYWRVIRMLATSYSANTAGVSLDEPYYGRTRCGTAMRGGIVAVDPRVVPLRTNIYVDGYGTGLACDTGSAIKGNRIDLGYDDANLRLWYRWVKVYLLTPVPANIRYILD
jgi:3D (Asp-Asp-Asp) domain-containing protein